MKHRLINYSVQDVSRGLPELNNYNNEEIRELMSTGYNLYICALGFEARCLSYSGQFYSDKYLFDEAVMLKYQTNSKDNNRNYMPLIKQLKRISKCFTELYIDFNLSLNNIKTHLISISKDHDQVNLYLDISVFSGNLIYSLINDIFDIEKINLIVLYAEAKRYAPYGDDCKDKESTQLSKGSGDAFFPGKDNPGKQEVPPYLIILPTFNYERTISIISEFFDAPEDDYKTIEDIFWIVGRPNMEQTMIEERAEMLVNINNIRTKNCCYAETIKYKEIISKLEELYCEKSLTRQIVIASHGSKMQSLGVALYSIMRPDVMVCHALPKEYKAKEYSKGCINKYYIPFGNVSLLREILFKLDYTEIVEE